MPIQLTASFTAPAPASPTVEQRLVVHFPEEIVDRAAQAERAGELLVVCCRDAAQAQFLAAMLLVGEVGSAVITGQTSSFDVRQAVEAFGYADFTVLLATDDVLTAWRAPERCRLLLHADLPPLPGTRQFFAALRARHERVPGAVQISQVA